MFAIFRRGKMQIYVHTRSFAIEAARVAVALPCWQMPVTDGSLLGNVTALAKERVR